MDINKIDHILRSYLNDRYVSDIEIKQENPDGSIDVTSMTSKGKMSFNIDKDDRVHPIIPNIESIADTMINKVLEGQDVKKIVEESYEKGIVYVSDAEGYIVVGKDKYEIVHVAQSLSDIYSGKYKVGILKKNDEPEQVAQYPLQVDCEWIGKTTSEHPRYPDYEGEFGDKVKSLGEKFRSKIKELGYKMELL